MFFNIWYDLCTLEISVGGIEISLSFLSVQVKLYKSDNLDNPINTVSLGQSLFFHFPPLDRDGEVTALIYSSYDQSLLANWNLGSQQFVSLCLVQGYVLMLHSTLSRSQFDFTLPQISFTSTGYHKHVTLTFNPTVRQTYGNDDDDENKTTQCNSWEKHFKY